MPTLIAQITDTHVGVGPGDTASADALAAAVETIAALEPAPAAVLLTGDIAADGRPRAARPTRDAGAPAHGEPR